MAIVAEVKLSGSLLYPPEKIVVTGSDGKPVAVPNPDKNPIRNSDGKLVYVHEREGIAVPITISEANATANADRYLVWLDNMPSSGVSFYLSGFTARTDTSNLPNPFRLDWKLYASGSCIVEDEPVWEASTWLADGLKVRNGMLVQATGLDARAWFLQVTTEAPGQSFTVSGSIEYWCPTQPTIGGPLIVTGSAVG